MKEYTDLLGQIQNKNDFIHFMELFRKKIKDESVQEYLESVCAWTEDMEGYYKNVNRALPKNINWDFIATLFYVGSIYE